MQRYSDSVADYRGQPLSGVSISVFDDNSALATIYSDNGITPIANPIVTTADGEFSFCAPDGRYSLSMSRSGVVTETRTDIVLYDPLDLEPGTYRMPKPGTAAQNAAALLVAMQSGKDTILFKGGTYEFNSAITHSIVGRTIRGMGRSRTTLKLANGHDVDYLFNSTAGASGAVFEHLTFDGNCANSANAYCGLLKADHSIITNGFTLRDMKVTQVRLYCVRLFPYSTDPVIERCEFRNVEDLMFEVNPWLRGRVIDCLFFDYSTNPTWGENTGPVFSLYGGSDSWIIRGNQFYPHQTNGYFAIESVWDGANPVRGMVFSNNVLDARNALNGNNYGTGVSGAFEGCTFTGNTWRNGAGSAHTCGLELVGRRNTITGNTVHNGQFLIGSNTGVSIGNSAGTVIANNTFVQKRTVAYPSPRQSVSIKLYDAVGVLIEGNSCYYEQSHMDGGIAIRMDGSTAESITIRGNRLSGYDKWGSGDATGISLAATVAASRIIIEDNLFEKLYRGLTLDMSTATGVHVKRNYYYDNDLNLHESGGSCTQSDNITL